MEMEPVKKYIRTLKNKKLTDDDIEYLTLLVTRLEEAKTKIDEYALIMIKMDGIIQGLKMANSK